MLDVPRSALRQEPVSRSRMGAHHLEDLDAVLPDEGRPDAGDGEELLLPAWPRGGEPEERAVGQDAEGGQAAPPRLGEAPGPERRDERRLRGALPRECALMRRLRRLLRGGRGGLPGGARRAP